MIDKFIVKIKEWFLNKRVKKDHDKLVKAIKKSKERYGQK